MWLPFLLLTASCHAALPPGAPPPPLPRADPRNNLQEGWVTVSRDHFNPTDRETFQMRYFSNDGFATSAQILIFVGGQAAASPQWVLSGLAHELAQELGAALFHTEHRYYGLTRPANDTSAGNLRWLSAHQALGDLAQFIQHVTSDQYEGGRYSNARVGLVGCSYAGALATWLQQSRPHLAHAAFSDSAPLRAQEDIPEYLQVVTETLRLQGGQACVDSVQAGVQGVAELLQTSAGAARVQELFGTCAPVPPNSPLDAATFFWNGVTEAFGFLVEFALPGDVAAACAVITNPGVADPVQRLASWVSAQPLSQPCLEAQYSAQVARHTDTDFDAPFSNRRVWTYQTCVEFGWYRSTSGGAAGAAGEGPFFGTVPLEYFHQLCRDYFGIDFDEQRLRAGIQRTNFLFGGLTQLPDRVVSVSGAGDPWAPLGPGAAHARPLSPVYVVEGLSHCRAIQPDASGEPGALSQELARVQRQVKSQLASFLQGGAGVAGGAGAARAGGGAVVLAIAVMLLLL